MKRRNEEYQRLSALKTLTDLKAEKAFENLRVAQISCAETRARLDQLRSSAPTNDQTLFLPKAVQNFALWQQQQAAELNRKLAGQRVSLDAAKAAAQRDVARRDLVSELLDRAARHPDGRYQR